MPQDEVWGAKVEAQRRLTFLSLGAFTANSSVEAAPRFGCPPGVAGVRILAIHVLSSAIPSDPDGVMNLIGTVNDISEAGEDIILAAVDLEVLTSAKDRWFKATLATETSEKELTMEAGDSLLFDLVSDSAAITTNPNVSVCIEWHPVPDLDTLERVGRPTDYQA